MTKNFIILTLVFELAFFMSRGQNSQPYPADRFLHFLNHYQLDSLQALLADNFQLKRTYTTYTNDKKSFIEKYVPNSKNFNATYKVLTITQKGQTTDFLVLDQSDFLKYLNIANPKWKMQVITNGEEKIKLVTIDTTESYRAYLIQTKEKGAQFEGWLKQKYPGETLDQLYNTAGLLTKRLKEYSTK